MPIISGVIASSKTGHLQPLAPTIGTASDGGTGTTVLVTYTPAATGPAATSFTATAYISGVSTGITATTSSTTSVTVSGLTAGTTYTFTVHATNATGNSPESSASNSVTPVVPSNFFLISQQTPSSASSITFSSIPSTYKSLQIRYSLVLSGGAVFRTMLNGDNGSNYSNHWLWGTGSSISASGQVSGQNISNVGVAVSTYPNVGIWDVIDYANTSKNKTVKWLAGGNNNNASAGLEMDSGAWLSTAAVNSITFFSSGTFTGTISLYGVS